MMLFLKKIIFVIFYYFRFLKDLISYKYNRLYYISKNPRDIKDLVRKTYLNSVMDSISNIKNDSINKTLFTVFFRDNFYKVFSFLYIKFFLKDIQKITTIEEYQLNKPSDIITRTNHISDKSQGCFYFSFHFIGRMESMFYYMTTKHDEFYILLQKSFFEKNGMGSGIGINSIEDLNNKYGKTFNKNVEIHALFVEDVSSFFRIKKLLENGKIIFVNFDFFSVKPEEYLNSPKKYVKYYINDKLAIVIPNLLFKLIEITKSCIIPIVFFRDGIINNSVKVYPKIYIDKNDNDYELKLKSIYDIMLENIKKNPTNVDPVLWHQFKNYEFEQYDNKILLDELKLSKKLKINKYFYFVNQENMDDVALSIVKYFKTYKSDNLTLKILQTISKKGGINNKLKNEYDSDLILKRVNFLFKAGALYFD